MQIVDLTEQRRDLFRLCLRDLFRLCLKDWSDKAEEAGAKRRQWLDRCQQACGLRAKLTLDSAVWAPRAWQRGESGCPSG